MMKIVKKQVKPFGSWKSPISGSSLVQNSLRPGQIQFDQDKVFWTEGRPSEKGRTALMGWSLGQDQLELSQAEWDVRNRAHEYGGGAFLPEDGRVFYLDNRDQQLYEILGDGTRLQLTRNKQFRYADMILDPQRQQLYVVGEDHSNPDETTNMLLKVASNGSGEQHIIAQGHDFYSNPRLSPKGKQLLFLSWDHPNMPWDGTQLWLGQLDMDGNLSQLHSIAGGAEESIFQPQWDPNGNIYFVSDRNGWWNIYEYSQGKTRCVLEMEAEFGLPQWVFGMSTFTVLESGKLLATYRDLKGSHLIKIDIANNSSSELDVPYADVDQIQGSGNLIAFIGSSPHRPAELVALELESNKRHILRRASSSNHPESSISKAELITFETRPGEPTYAWFYSPLNPLYEAPEGELPPLIVLSHGGPTAYSSGVFSLNIQYWTSRGFAIVDVNYSGSTGFGRAYRERLNGTWGIRDVEDCAAAAEYLAQTGRVDQDRLIIKGGSAGGYTTLAALTFTNVFKAGASYYGIGDLELLAKDTHKFESHYLDGLVGAYPEEQQLYRDRSPLNHTDLLDCPVIFLQGLDDPVVPPNQAESMVLALKQKGIPVAYIPFKGESHGFRQAATVVKAIESEYYFYTKIFGFEPADSLDEIEIFNL